MTNDQKFILNKNCERVSVNFANSEKIRCTIRNANIPFNIDKINNEYEICIFASNDSDISELELIIYQIAEEMKGLGFQNESCISPILYLNNTTKKISTRIKKYLYVNNFEKNPNEDDLCIVGSYREIYINIEEIIINKNKYEIRLYIDELNK